MSPRYERNRTPLGREMLREVIEQPAKVARLGLEEGLVAVLVADTGSGEALPLLAFILRQLAEGLPPGATVSLSRYRELGGVQGALARHADAALTEAVGVSGLTESEVLAGLTGLVTVDGTGRRGRRRIPLPGPGEPLRVALGVLVDQRLLFSDTDEAGQMWVTVAHEALLTGWRPLDAAISGIIAALRTARVVEQAATEWTSSGRPEHYLWDDKRLTATLVTLGMVADNSSHDSAAPAIVALDDDARAFLDATARRVSMVKEREGRRRTVIIAVLSTLLLLVTTASLLLVTTASVFAFSQRNTAQTQRDNAIVSQITTQADRLRSADVSLAAQLDLTGYRRRPTPDLYTTLITTSTTVLSTPLTGHTNAVNSVVFSPDGHTLASGSDDQTVRLWNVTDPAHPTPLGQPLTAHTGFVYAVVFSADGHTLASGSRDQTVRLWGMNVDQAIQRICVTTRNTLTPAKWERYVSPDLPYNPPCQTS
jgi:hypothetical protein